jgi:CubicO group peptidase (beta-lactamase class C family)
MIKELPNLLRRAIKRHQVPGASLAILRNSRIIATAAAGLTSLETRVPVTKDTVFQIGSITKPFTATLAMQLVDEGLLDLDTPVQHYLPGFRVADLEVSRRVTPRHFLSHQSGIDGDFFVDAGRGDDNVERIVAMATMVPSLFPIGTKLSYCNLGFAVLGRVIEVLTGKSWDMVLKDRIFESLEMNHAFSQPEQAIRFSCAIGHVPGQKKGTWQASVVPYLSLGQKAAGSTPSMTAVDLLGFARMHLDGGRNRHGEKVLTAGSVKAMQRRQIRATKYTPHCITGWGLGWMLFEWNGHKLYGHDGGTIGQNAFLRILPEKGLAVALLTNGGDTAALFEEVFGPIFKSLGRVTLPDLPEASPDIDVDLSPLAASYQNLNQVLEFTVRGGALTLGIVPNGASAADRTMKLAFIDKDTARLATGDKMTDRSIVKFSGYVDGTPRYASLGLRQYKRLD